MKPCRFAFVVMVIGIVAGGCAALRLREESRPELAETISSDAEARWTRTTRESASTPAHHTILERARKKTIVGEVVDVSCFLQLGKRGEAHITCGQKCVRNGQPIGMLTDEGRLYLIIPEEHHPRRDGEVNLRERFAQLMAKRVRVSGMVTKYEDYRALFVRTLPSED